jgi:poly(A) polymerase
VRIMVGNGILKPILPEITADRLSSLAALIDAERMAGIAPDGLRRLAALLPDDPAVGESIATRLRLSNKARKRLACAVDRRSDSSPEALVYRLGGDCAVDRLLLGGRVDDAVRAANWQPPRLPIGGGALIARGLSEGPIVARTLRAIEDRWVEAGFPDGDKFEAIVSDALTAAQR